MANSILSGNQNYKLIFEDHACSDPDHENKNHKTLVECASACDGLIFVFAKGASYCTGTQCNCACMIGTSAADETCPFKSDANLDVYASKSENQEGKSTDAATGESIVNFGG